MDHLQIEKILEKYWIGETNLEEEELLKGFFNNNQVPQHLKIYAPLFQSYVYERDKEFLGATFNEKVLSVIESKEKQSPDWKFFIKIAATVLIIFGLGLGFTKINPSQQQDHQLANLDTFDDPDLAYQQAKIALGLLSSKMNKGTEKLEELSEFNRAKDIISNQ